MHILHLMLNKGTKGLICCLFASLALDALLEFSASTFEQSGNGRYLDNTINYKEDIRFLIERKDSVSMLLYWLMFFWGFLIKGSCANLLMNNAINHSFIYHPFIIL